VNFDRLIRCQCYSDQLNVGPKKFFCDTIIKRVSKVENAVEIIENKAVELVVAPMCNQILTVCRLPTVLAEKFSTTFSHL
jgi:hypothetical protein